ncbi:MAG: CapA family protein [Firmicutes bacterium]|nr:CapA family protein [Bacillota bacterium]
MSTMQLERAERRARREAARKRKRIVAIAVLAAIVIVLGALVLPSFFDGKTPPPEPVGGDLSQMEDPSDGREPEPVPEPEPEPPVSLRVVCVGDVMTHSTQIKAQYDSATDTYDFADNFQYVKGYIEEADLALCNLETCFAGGTPSGYPIFNAPDILAQNLADAGFDVGILVNNHTLDKGKSGLDRTAQIVAEAGMIPAGFDPEGAKKYTLTEVDGVTIGVVAYTYETPMSNGRHTLNGNYIPDDYVDKLNSFCYENFDSEMDEIKGAIAAAKEAGADIVICYYHWGEEYQRSPNNWQKEIAARSVAAGADVIFASHPHVPQGMEYLTDEASGRQVPVFWSMGNFVSNQREETLDMENRRYTEQGMIAGVNLEYDVEADELLTISMDVIPTWVDRYKLDDGYHYAIVPLDADLETNPALQTSGHLERAQRALGDMKELMGEQYIRK